MIDLNDPDEQLMTIKQAVAWLESRGAGKVSPRSVWRWIAHGIQCNGKAVKLDACKLGGRRQTSVKALTRFVAAQSAGHVPQRQPGVNPWPARPGERSAAVQAALDALR